MNQHNGRPILITGSIRSGTTWVGKILGASPQVAVIIEPFNKLHRMGTFGLHWQYQYTYVTPANEEPIARALRKTLALKYDVLAQIRAIRSPRNIAGFIRDFTRFQYGRFIRHPRVLLKDPIALFSAAWLAEKFKMDVVVMIRHPAAFASSYKRIQEPNRFADLLRQKELMRDLLYPFEDEIARYANRPVDLIDQAILLWKITFHMIQKYRREHSEWFFHRHEDLALNPQHQFKILFSQLGVPFTEKIERTIIKMNGRSNPVEAPAGQLHCLKRNSREVVKIWKYRLTREEIKRIRQATEELASAYYSPESWK